MNYEEMTHEDLVGHCRAYSASLHKLINENSAYRLLFGPLTEARRLVSEGFLRSRSSFLPVPESVLTDGVRRNDGFR